MPHFPPKNDTRHDEQAGQRTYLDPLPWPSRLQSNGNGIDFPRVVRLEVAPTTYFHQEQLAMADDKTKTGREDDNLISFKQRYEVDYAVKQLQKQVPDTSRKEAKDALFEAAKKTSPSEGREKVMRAARKILKD